jgi:hypothetical protein
MIVSRHRAFSPMLIGEAIAVRTYARTWLILQDRTFPRATGATALVASSPLIMLNCAL